ncbi:MAG: thioredoxin-disulfide reductase [Deltaproteobacteria bacterium]|nr:thioredoxin-disulfide reductase [Deltaproteobacteria bacterium]
MLAPVRRNLKRVRALSGESPRFSPRSASATLRALFRELASGTQPGVEQVKVLIVGSGPAGYTAAIYAARANLAPVLVEGDFDANDRSVLPGGQLMITTEVENYPGFPKGVMGPELMAQLREQAERFGTKIVSGFATKLDLSRRPFAVEVQGEAAYSADALIIATGAVAKLLEIPGERELMGYGVSACATCDGAFFRDQEVVVVGGGDTAMEEALFLTKFASRVTLVHRRDAFRASKVMQKRVEKNSKIRFIFDSVVTQVLGEKPSRIGGAGGVTAVRVKNLKTGVEQDVPSNGFFVAIGHRPNTRVFGGQLELDENGYIVVEKGTTRTSVAGVFACGDVQDPTYRQAITAAGTGCMAAIDAERWLEAEAVH